MNSMDKVDVDAQKLKLLYINTSSAQLQDSPLPLNDIFQTVTILSSIDQTFELYKKNFNTPEHFDIIIMDIDTLDSDTIMICKNLKEFKQNQIIVIISQDKDSDYLVEALNIGVNKYIAKPFDRDSVVSLLTELSTITTINTQQEDKEFLLRQQNKIIDENVYITTSDLNGKILEISQAYLDFTGYAKEDIIGQNHRIFRNHDIDTNVIKHLWETISNGKEWKGELKNNKLSGEEYWISTTIRPLYDKNNVMTGYTAVKRDITNQKRLEELSIQDPLTLIHNRRYFDTYFKRELKRSAWKKERFSLLLLGVDYYEDYRDKVGRLKSDKVILQISDGISECLSSKIYEIFKVTETEFAIILLNYDDEHVKDFSTQIISCVESLKIENPHSKVSQYFTLSIGVANIQTDKHTLYCNDIYNIADANLTKAKELGRNRFVMEVDESYLQELKDIDVITKLPNRGVLVHDISLLQEDAMLMILHIKQINSLKNLYGFDFTSEVVGKKAQQLKDILRDEETSLYSLNLQEFAILVTNKNLFDKYFLLLKHSILLNNDFYINNLDQYITADFTVGIAYGIGGIFNHADLVLQEAILSKISYKVYKSNQTARQLEEDTLKRLRVYKQALHEGNIIPYFQPIVDTYTGKLIKYEALARLQTEDGSIVSPYFFLDSAKEDKSFEYFTRQMMQKVFIIYSKNSADISINLSYENINSESMIQYIKNRLNKYGGEGITFEIVESEDIRDYKVLEEFIGMVKNYGCKISVDDFGSGYSNFKHVTQLDIDFIKLDGSLIENLNKDENIKHMIKGLLVYAKNANIKTIAEFVSSKELADTVKELGIDYIQGYYHGEPKSPEEYGLKN
ncbi:EAL domain-containing protein [Sulfurimonas aquatica]|uniref:EAL domain-containing protein n=1 Tax=Sulfurimonas aquatica TaxID=2672570 RepID=A0A975B104_9BACT|nr:EAL domain-containing protein [Sulfurimonas aquatica]QSZ42242.1 EAL domain-containing protein [Sulfurimonas aquatica]